jgi:hypothetical protein
MIWESRRVILFFQEMEMNFIHRKIMQNYFCLKDSESDKTERLKKENCYANRFQ